MFIHTYTRPKDPILGGEWYIAAWQTSKENRSDIQRWCYRTYGIPGYRVNTDDIRWKDGIQYGEAIFSKKEDLEWFVLRWE